MAIVYIWLRVGSSNLFWGNSDLPIGPWAGDRIGIPAAFSPESSHFRGQRESD
jgi:hypothetical protein